MASTTGTISSPGIGSNLDVNTIVSQLMNIESQPLVNIQTQQAHLNANLSAWGQLNSAFSGFTQSITSATLASTFQPMQATSSNISVLTATATQSAQAGSHTLTVSTLAQAQSLSSGDFADPGTVMGTGSLTIQFGTFTPANTSAGTPATFTPNANTTAKSITIDAAHNTLSGVVNAINAANAGVTASIVNDGSGNRLVITSNNTGTANSLKITAADSNGAPLTDGTTAGQLGQLAYDPTLTAGSGQNLSQNLAPKDATFALDGINIVKSSNTVTDVLTGVTLNLAGVGTTTVTTGQNNAAVTSAIQGFVSAYNNLWGTLNSYTTYNATTQSGGQLNGDPTAMAMVRALPRILTNGIPGWNGTLKSLTDIGVTLQKDGTLSLDQTTLTQALQSHFSDVAGLFASTGSASDSQIQYTGTASATQPGTYAVSVTQMATQGQAVGVQDLSGGAQVQAGTNDNLTVDLDGVTAAVSLVPGSYTAAQLAAQVQSQINGASAFKSAGLGVTVTVNASNGLTITSNNYGASSKVQLSGSAVTSVDSTYSSLFAQTSSTTGTTQIVANPSQTAGTDVAGTINGVAATGSGQYLMAQTPSGATKNPAQGLSIKITGGTKGDRGTVNFSQGIATQFLNYANSVTDANTGLIANRENGINQSLTTLNNRIDQENVHLSAVKAAYMAQFTALDTLLGGMTTTSGFLTQQLSSMPWATSSATTNAQKNGG